jgi:hypothetical protein
MVEIRIDKDNILLEVLGWHKIWALKGRLQIKKSHIKSIKLAEKKLRPPCLRFPGAYIPGVIITGTYYGPKRKEFWDTRLKGKAIEIDLENDIYTKIVVDVSEPQKILEELNRA